MTNLLFILYGGIKISIKDNTQTHLGSIWHPSELSELSSSTNEKLVDNLIQISN